jgi:hypothetical protein
MANSRKQKLAEIMERIGATESDLVVPASPLRYVGVNTSFVKGPLSLSFSDTLNAMARNLEQAHSHLVDETTVYDLETEIIYTPVVVKTIRVTTFRPLQDHTLSKTQPDSEKRNPHIHASNN